jgi:hypothetical protein
MIKTLCVLVFIASVAVAQQVTVPMEASHWILHDWKRWPANAPASGFGDFSGRRSLHVVSGLAYVPELKMQDGVVEADVAPDPRGAFFGIAFRVQSPKDFELIYFRPGSSGTPEAVQYTPTLNGAIAWQLFHGPGAQATADIPDKWMHVKIEVSGLTATLYLDGATKPSLTVTNLAGDDAAGSVGFWGLFGGGHIANLSYDARPPRAQITARKATAEPGVITQWQISEAFDIARVSPLTYPQTKSRKWESVEAESHGLLILNRYRESPEMMPTPPRAQMNGTVPGSKVVFARTIINADRPETRSMWIGFSDEAVVYLNGKPLFNGKNAWRFRDEGASLGLIDYNDRVYLPLRKGANELLVAVTEFMGGWGLQCELVPAETRSPAPR